MKLSDLTITILFDNCVHDPRLANLWGFSCLIEYKEHKILMDTGSNGRVLLNNMKAMDISPTDCTDLFISHNHWDHIGGIDSMLELNRKMRLILPSSLSRLYMHDLKKECRELVRIDDKPFKITEDIYSTGVINCVTPEQAIIIDTNKGLIIITGCAHPGLDEIMQLAMDQHQKPIYLLGGGFHYMRSLTPEIEEGMAMLHRFNIKNILPTHCTGNNAIKFFRKEFNVLAGGAGKVVNYKKAEEVITTCMNDIPLPHAR